jgi:GT2 family glycosyltransferase
MRPTPYFDLICATIHRNVELELLLLSLRKQPVHAFRLILADQNKDLNVVKILENYPDLNVLHLRIDKPGLSGARNLALQHATASCIAFPDDDCQFPLGLLESIQKVMEENSDWDGISIFSRDQAGRPSGGRWETFPCQITSHTAWTTAISYTLFLRAHVIQKTGLFDVELGVGCSSWWKSGEETDYLLRALAKGFKFFYRPDFYMLHPVTPRIWIHKTLRKAFFYGCGMGRVLAKHQSTFFTCCLWLLRSVGGCCWNLLRLRWTEAAWHSAAGLGRFCGIIRGWLD